MSARLDDLTREQQADPAVVLRVLKANGGFGAWEASATPVIARTITHMCHKGCSIVRNGVRTDYGRLITTDLSLGYPLTKVTLTEGGERLLADATEEAKP